MGFLNIIPRQGVYVADYARKGSFETLSEILKYNGGKLTVKMATGIVEMRNAVEGGALIKLAASHTDEDIIKLRAMIEELKALIGEEISTYELAELTSKFHYQICDLCGNDIFPLVMNAFAPLGEVLWKYCAHFWGPRELN